MLTVPHPPWSDRKRLVAAILSDITKQQNPSYSDVCTFRADEANHGTTCCCTALHMVSKSLAKMLPRAANAVKNSNAVLPPAFVDLLRHALVWCKMHKCLNIKVLQILSSMAQAIAETVKAPVDSLSYGRLYFLMNDTLKGIQSTFAEVKSTVLDKLSTVHADDSVTLQAVIVQTEELLAQCALLWEARESNLRNDLQALSFNNEACDRLNSTLDQLHADHMLLEVEVAKQNTRILADVQNMLQHVWRGNILPVINPFGSRVSILGGLDSDLDICLALYERMADGSRRLIPVVIDSKKNKDKLRDRQHMWRTSSILMDIRKALYRSRVFKLVEMVAWSRVPIIKFVHLPTGVEIDICVGNELGLQNTLLLKAYCAADVRLHKFMLAVKQWAKARRINDAREGTLSSFSWCVLALYAAKHFKVPITPGFQLTEFAHRMLVDQAHLLSVEAVFCEGNRMFNLIPAADPNHETTPAHLLLHFFSLFGLADPHGFDYFQEIISIRGSERSKLSNALPLCMPPIDMDVDDENNDEENAEAVDKLSDSGDGEQVGAAGNNYLLRPWRIKIEDPFDCGDLGRVIDGPEHQQHIIGEFRRGVAIFLQELAIDAQCAWAKISELNIDLPVGGFCICTKCKSIGHVEQFCPVKHCSKCGKGGHAGTVCNIVTKGMAFATASDKSQARLLTFMPRPMAAAIALIEHEVAVLPAPTPAHPPVPKQRQQERKPVPPSAPADSELKAKRSAPKPQVAPVVKSVASSMATAVSMAQVGAAQNPSVGTMEGAAMDPPGNSAARRHRQNETRKRAHEKAHGAVQHIAGEVSPVPKKTAAPREERNGREGRGGRGRGRGRGGKESRTVEILATAGDGSLSK